MPETKTFKNPDKDIFNYRRGVLEDGRPAWHVVNDNGSTDGFRKDEWDMEVTFTKKVKPVEAGQWRETGRNGAEVCVYVLAIYGKVAWVTDDPEWLEEGKLNAWTEPLDKLR